MEELENSVAKTTPPPTAELQARKRRVPLGRPSGVPSVSPSCASFGASDLMRRSLAISVSPRQRSFSKRAGSLCRHAASMRGPTAASQRLRNLWRRGLNMSAIGRQLSVFASGVFAKVHELGFSPRTPRPHAAWHAGRAAKLRALQRKGLSLAEIGQRLSVPKRVVACKIRRQTPQT
jgi:hypothetical protein